MFLTTFSDAKSASLEPPLLATLHDLVNCDDLDNFSLPKGHVITHLEMHYLLESLVTSCKPPFDNLIWLDVSKKHVLRGFKHEDLLEVFLIDAAQSLSFVVGSWGNMADSVFVRKQSVWGP